MFRRRLYYTLKPILPWWARMALRRVAARRIRRASQGIWPIDPAAATKPADWPGWPDGKKLAVVLTHDVEGPEGLAKCRELAELEMSLGFRSSFNFIPEGDYEVPDSLRDWLTDNGFEVGVHDLHHDGKLYLNRDHFAACARRINFYLQAWHATGYRSGFMLHNLDWQHDLDAAYDCSTFDTDPFEPQPDGVGTIFPFWVEPPADTLGRPGYVELPYTLVQDSTLFLVLGERNTRIWEEKLAWIAGNQGMALLNVHPDFLHFDGDRFTRRLYPASAYAHFLRHITQRYGDRLWTPLPREMAAWYRQSHQPAPVLRSSP